MGVRCLLFYRQGERAAARVLGAGCWQNQVCALGVACALGQQPFLTHLGPPITPPTQPAGVGSRQARVSVLVWARLPHSSPLAHGLDRGVSRLDGTE